MIFGNDKVVIEEACPLEERSFTNIIGAWAKIILDKDVWGAEEYSCVMTMEQVEKSMESRSNEREKSCSLKL